MKVCDVVLNSVWYDPRVRKQINEYLAHGIDVVTIGSKSKRYDKEKVSLIPCKTVITEIDERYVGHQKGILNKFKREKLSFEVVRDAIIAEKPDVIHANDLNALIPAFAAKRKLGCRIIYDSHEVCVENFTAKKSKLAILYKMAERYMVKRVDLMICVSHAAAEYFAKEYKIKKPMVITNCAPKKEIPVIRQHEKNEGFEVLNHGWFYRGRGYDIMAKSCGLFDDYDDIRIAIRGFGAMEQELRDTVAQLDKKNRFVFYPSVTVQELVPEAAKSYVGVAITEPICLNFKLSVSNKIFEYVAAGLPVIMSDIPEHRYLNDKYNFGIVLRENTPEAFAEAVIKLYTDREFYNVCAENAKRLAEEVNWENEFGKLIDFLKNIQGE